MGTSLNVKNDDTCRLAGELARLTGRKDTILRGGSISLNSLQAVDKWLSALVMPPPSLALAG